MYSKAPYCTCTCTVHVACVYSSKYSHQWEENQRCGVEQPFQAGRRKVVLVEEEQSNEVDGEGEEEEVGYEAFFCLLALTTLHTQLTNFLHKQLKRDGHIVQVIIRMYSYRGHNGVDVT